MHMNSYISGQMFLVFYFKGKTIKRPYICCTFDTIIQETIKYTINTYLNSGVDKRGL